MEQFQPEPAPERPTVPVRSTPNPQPPTPELELWSGRTSWKHHVGRVALWVLGNALAAWLIGRFASQSDRLDAGEAGWLILLVGGLSALFLLGPVALRILGRRYRLTSQRLFVETGILSKTIDQTELIRIDDVRLYKSFFDRLFGLGTVSLLSSDATDRALSIEGIAEPDRVAEAVRGHMRAQRGQAVYVESI